MFTLQCLILILIIGTVFFLFFFASQAYASLFSGAGVVSGTLHLALWDKHISSSQCTQSVDCQSVQACKTPNSCGKSPYCTPVLQKFFLGESPTLLTQYLSDPIPAGMGICSLVSCANHTLFVSKRAKWKRVNHFRCSFFKKRVTERKAMEAIRS